VSSNQKALIFGCTGQDGSLMAQSLINQGIEPIGISTKKQPNLKNLKYLNVSNFFIQSIKQFRTYELLDLLEKIKPIEIYNLSAQSSVGLSFSKVFETFESISHHTNVLLEACKISNFKGRIFFAGSSEIFGNTPKPVTNLTELNPKSPYAIAKIASMNMVKMYRETYGLKCVTGILFNHESQLRDERFVTQKIIKSAAKAKFDKEFKLKLGNLNIKRDWGWAEEYVIGMQRITRASKLKDQIICTGKSISLKKFAELAYKKLDLDWRDYIMISEELFRPNDIQISAGDPEPMSRDLSWKAEIHYNEIIEKLINHELNKK
tara:strand:+ start:13393 stop:14352 length:960 start_codon:yes stop_codon:yes gene_type:complete